MPEQSPPQAPHPAGRKRYGFGGFLCLIVLVCIASWGIATRIDAAAALRKQTDEAAIVTVAVIAAPRGPLHEEVVLPGTLQAWHEAPIYARTSGYLKDWKTDIGAHVKAGDLLAEIETPEVDAQFSQAQADLATAIANDTLAQSTAKRWLNLLKSHAVSKQASDEKVGAAAATAAIVASSRDNLDHLRQLENFKRVVAPFSGVITARDTDTGALINAGNGGAGAELFSIAETDKLRVYVQVPEDYTQAVTPAMPATLGVAEYPGRNFTAKLTQTADAVDPATRTLLAEFEVDNADNALLPGSYAEVHLNLPSTGTTVHLPVNTLIFRAAGLQVATVVDGKAHLQPITIGRDYGSYVEVTTGVAPGDQVIINPPDALTDGQKVRLMSPKKSLPNSAAKPENAGKP